MKNLGVQEAADAIRGKFFADRSFRGDPAAAHGFKFVKDVAKALNAGDDPADVMHVMQLLREEDIALHAGQQYPKYATRKWDRTAKVVHDENEEQAWVNEPQPEPAHEDDVPPVRTLDAPVQDLSTDLRNSVPGDANRQAMTPVPKVPSAVTNRDAAQDAYARQSIEGKDRDAAAAAYDEQNPGLDHRHADATHDDNFDDDQVHVEDLAPIGSRQQGGAPYAKPADVGLMKNDDPDGDGIAGQDINPTHDSVLGTDEPQPRSGDSSAGRTDAERRPVGNRTGKSRPL